MAALDGPLRAFERDHADQLARSPERTRELISQAKSAAARIGLDIDWI